MRYKWLPVFDVSSCVGCRACTPYCPSGSLVIEDGFVSFKNPDACLSDERCVQECPAGGIHMEWVETTSTSSRGIVTDRKPEIMTASSK